MADKKEEIVNAARRAVQRDGLRSVSFRTLADEVAVKSSSVHYHFPTKHDLAASLVEDYTDTFEARLTVIEQTETSLSAKLEALVDIFADVLKGNDLCLCGMMAAEVTALDKTTRKALQRFFEITEGWLEKTLPDKPRRGLLALPKDEIARIFLSALEGAILIDRVEEGHARLDAMRALARSL